MKTDMLVKLYDLNSENDGIEKLQYKGISIKRALPADKHRVIDYIRTTFNKSWASECEVSFSNNPVSCFIAVKEGQLIGFACYEVTAKGYFGPMGVTESVRGIGIGKALLLKSLLSMREEGYGYGIIGWVDDSVNFYKKTVNAIAIEDSFPGIYARLIDH